MSPQYDIAGLTEMAEQLAACCQVGWVDGLLSSNFQETLLSDHMHRPAELHPEQGRKIPLYKTKLQM